MLDQEFFTALADHCKQMFPGQIAAAALTGSHLYGWATETSDFDLIALLDSPLPDAQPRQTYVSGLLQDALSEILVIDKTEMERIVNLTNRTEFSSIPVEDLLVMEKIVSARPVYGAGVWSAQLAEFDRDSYNRRIAGRQRRYAGNTFDDVVGCWRQGQLDTAVDCMRMLLRNEAEALLAAHGDTNGRSKWLSRRLDDCTALPPGFRSRFRRAHFGFDLTDETTMESWLLFAFEVHLECQQLYFAACEGFPAHEETAQNGSERVVATRPLFVAQLRDDWAVKSKDRAVSVSRDVAAMLLAAHQPVLQNACTERGALSAADTATLLDAGLLEKAVQKA